MARQSCCLCAGVASVRSLSGVQVHCRCHHSAAVCCPCSAHCLGVQGCCGQQYCLVCSGAGSHDLVLQGSDATVSIGMAHSRDGVRWAKACGRHPGGSVLQRSTTPDDWDSYAVTNPCLVEGLDGQLLMYYHSGRPRPAQ